jgi:biopolymer transport protein ExbD
MAELDTGGGGGKKGGKPRGKKASTRIDMTAMVDLAFLLLTFFVLTTTISKPNVMPVVIPPKVDPNDKEEVEPPKVAETKILTLILGQSDLIYAYPGILDPASGKSPEVLTINFDPKKLRTLIKERQNIVKGQFGDAKELIVLIKPLSTSRYNNMVDILDEMNISEVKKYTLAELNDNERELIVAQKEPENVQDVAK